MSKTSDIQEKAKLLVERAEHRAAHPLDVTVDDWKQVKEAYEKAIRVDKVNRVVNRAVLELAIKSIGEFELTEKNKHNSKEYLG